mmetsp:Transcript_14767/g.28589  ORF Transcript_14767/g.28589 Transcript_14767/m.28589 type:complete len:202 (+) Transcript_14767:1259-1864(+)
MTGTRSTSRPSLSALTTKPGTLLSLPRSFTTAWVVSLLLLRQRSSLLTRSRFRVSSLVARLLVASTVLTVLVDPVFLTVSCTDARLVRPQAASSSTSLLLADPELAARLVPLTFTWTRPPTVSPSPGAARARRPQLVARLRSRMTVLLSVTRTLLSTSRALLRDPLLPLPRRRPRPTPWTRLLLTTRRTTAGSFSTARSMM